MTVDVEAKLAELNLVLPQGAAPVANYLPYVQTGNLIFISGQLSKGTDNQLIAGQLGDALTVEQGTEAARMCGLQLLAQIKTALGGNWSRLRRLVKLTCMVNSSPTFTQHPGVANGCSDLMVQVLGEEVGRHARCAYGVAQLPLGAAVEIDLIVEVCDA